MKEILICCLLVVVSCSLFAQPSKQEKLQQLKTREDVKITEVEKDILKLEYRNGKTLYKNIGEYKPTTNTNLQQTTYSTTYDSTIIDISTIDTMLYYQKYSYWQTVPLGNFRTLLAGDVNKNGRPELYGQMKDYWTDYTDIKAYEMDTQGKFKPIYTFDSTYTAEVIYDIDDDGNMEMRFKRKYEDTIYNNGWGQYKFVRKPTDTSLANLFSFVFEPNYIPTQQNDVYFGNWDLDNLTDQILIRLNNPPSVNIYEYNPLKPNFDSVYQFDYYYRDHYYGGFSIGDFDQDCKTEFLAGSLHGKVLSIENTGNNSYASNWEGKVETYNAYLCAETNDIDGNGKKEIWIGGDAFYSGVSVTRITLFESDGNNSYQVVGRIDIVGIFSFDAGNIQVIDVDKDGKEEVLLGLDQTILILKFNGSKNHQTYEVFYIKQNELALAGVNSVYYGATLYDLIDDGKEELIINLDNVRENNGGLKFISYIYKPNFIVSVDKEHDPSPKEFSLSQNYPNPFNPSTEINYQIPSKGFVTLKVYDMLGNEVSTLVNEWKEPGSYNAQFTSSGKQLASGMYFYTLTAGKFSDTKKFILLK